MKIYHICYIPSKAHGIYSVLNRLPEEQRKLGHDVRVYNFWEKELDNEKFVSCNLEDFKNISKNERPDVAIIHSVFYKPIIGISRYLKKSKIPYFVELHGAFSMQNMHKSWFKKVIARKLFFNSLLKDAISIIYLNQQEYCNSAIREINSGCTIVPNGCDLPKNTLSKTQSPIIEFVYLGRIDINHKGLDFLITAIKELHKQGRVNNIHFSFYGTGKDHDLNWLKNQIVDLAGIIDFYGPVYGKDKEDAYKNANVFLLTSRYEGFPMSILEALSYEIPCLISPMTNVADIIKHFDCGWVAPLETAQLADKILKAADECQKKSNNCIKAASAYQWSEIAKGSIKEYEYALRNTKTI